MSVFCRFWHLFTYNHARGQSRLLSKGGLQWLIQDLWKGVWSQDVRSPAAAALAALYIVKGVNIDERKMQKYITETREG